MRQIFTLHVYIVHLYKVRYTTILISALFFLQVCKKIYIREYIILMSKSRTRKNAYMHMHRWHFRYSLYEIAMQPELSRLLSDFRCFTRCIRHVLVSPVQELWQKGISLARICITIRKRRNYIIEKNAFLLFSYTFSGII